MINQEYLLASDYPLTEEDRSVLNSAMLNVVDEIVLGSNPELDPRLIQAFGIKVRPRIAYYMNSSPDVEEAPSRIYTREAIRLRVMEAGDQIIVRAAQQNQIQVQAFVNAINFSSRLQRKDLDKELLAAELSHHRTFVNFDQAMIMADPTDSAPGIIVGNFQQALRFLLAAEPGVFQALKSRYWIVGTDDLSLGDLRLTTSYNEYDAVLTEYGNILPLSTESPEIYPISESRASLLSMLDEQASQGDYHSRDCFVMANEQNIDQIISFFNQLEEVHPPISGLVAVSPSSAPRIAQELTKIDGRTGVYLRLIVIRDLDDIAAGLDRSKWSLILGPPSKQLQGWLADSLSRGVPAIVPDWLYFHDYAGADATVMLDPLNCRQALTEIRSTWPQLNRLSRMHNKRFGIGFQEMNLMLGEMLEKSFLKRGWVLDKSQLKTLDNIGISTGTTASPGIHVLGQARFR